MLPQEKNIDLDAYFQRIGYDGERMPTLVTLQAIHIRQPHWHPIGKQTGTPRAASESALYRIFSSGLIASSAMFLIWILTIA
jgi:hypothetical protein